jgi:hypothetical protein
MRISGAIVVVIIAALLACAASAATRRPYFWTEARVSAGVQAVNPLSQAEKLIQTVCRGTGTSYQGRYRQFQCGMYYEPEADAFYTLVLTVKVRPVGKTGKWCVFGGYAGGFNDFNGRYSWATLSNPFSADGLSALVTPERLCPGIPPPTGG